MSSSKICLVSMENAIRCHYVLQYIRCLEGRPFDFLVWDRDLSNEDIGQARTFAYRHKVRHGSPSNGQRLEKLTGYVGFLRYAQRVLEQEDYERVVCLTGVCAVVLNKVLLNKYSGRFIIDIRDYWHEDIKRYHETEQRLIEASAFPVISSPAYRKFLGDHDFRVMHNSQILSEEQRAIADHPHERPLRIVSVGAGKNLSFDRRVLDCFANDERFFVAFRGRGYDELTDYIDGKGIRNAEATGEFDFSQTMDKYRDCDIVLSMYGNGSPYWDYALSNKLYFAAQLGLPILVCEKTAMAEMTEGYDLGIAFDPGDAFAKDRAARLFNPDVSARREAGRARFLEMVERDNSRTFADITDFFDC